MYYVHFSIFNGDHDDLHHVHRRVLHHVLHYNILRHDVHLHDGLHDGDVLLGKFEDITCTSN